MVNYEMALRSLWIGRATVKVWEGTLDPATGRTEPREKVLLREEPCRISFSASPSTEPREGAAAVAQTVTLYIAPDIGIPEGSKITVTQNGVTGEYERSGRAAVYSRHQEITLALWKGWA